MVRVLLYLAVFACLAVGAVWLADRPGEVSVLWQGYRIETSVAIAAIGVVVLAFLAMLAWGLMRFVLGLPTAFSFASRARRRARGFEAVSRGMVAIGAGDPIAAGRHAVDARRFAADETGQRQHRQARPASSGCVDDTEAGASPVLAWPVLAWPAPAAPLNSCGSASGAISAPIGGEGLFMSGLASGRALGYAISRSGEPAMPTRDLLNHPMLIRSSSAARS